VGVEGATSATQDGDLVIVDGGAGRLLIRPAAFDRERYEARARGQRAKRRSELRAADLPAETRDGRRVELLANIERSDEIPWIRSCGARGVGLFRTEFLFLERPEPPDEEEQLAHYRAVVEGVAPDGAVIRTIDVGGDKLPAGVHRRVEANPALGLRGVRLSLADRPLLRTQLRALLRAGVHGRLRLLLPLVTGVEEVLAVRAEIEEARAALEREGVAAAAGLELGVVVETPAAVAVADLLAREADFFSIGTNDLVQYTVAVDRENEHVAYLYDPLHPAVLRQILSVVEQGHRAGRSVAMCGEMAGDPLCSLVLVGLGLDELSMNAAAVPRVKRILRGTSFDDARALARELLDLRSAAEVADRLRKEMLRRFPEEFAGTGDEA
jgi:phosphotransferase system enzyme I (PtsI)